MCVCACLFVFWLRNSRYGLTENGFNIVGASLVCLILSFVLL